MKLEEAKKQRDKWLASLKPGDEVAWTCGYDRFWVIEKVTRMTPSGRIVVGSRTFNPNGWERASGSKRAVLKIPSDDIREEVHRRKQLRRLNGVKWERLSTDLLNRVLGYLEAGGTQDSGES